MVVSMSDRTRTDYGAGARVVFMGSPEFAVPSLRELAEHFKVVAVITQPDRPAGRGRAMQPSPVKEAALELGLPLWQPESLRGAENLEHLASLRPDCVVVAAYGEILSQPVLDVPPRGFLNVHASLLPLYRGASPVSAAILAGERETGVTIMRLDSGMDTGPVLAQDRTPILSDESRGSLEAKLAELGAGLLVRVLPAWLAGDIVAEPQDDSRATVTRPLTKTDGEVDWNRPADYTARQIRAMDPWPGAYTHWGTHLLKLWQAEAVNLAGKAAPGTVSQYPDGITVIAGQGQLRLLTVQPEGKPRMSVDDFVRGRPGFIGARLGA